MSILETIQSKRDEIIALGAEYGARNFRIFGSVLEGKESPNDIDFLIDYQSPDDPERSGIGYYRLENQLGKMLGHPVHLTQAALVKPRYENPKRVIRRYAGFSTKNHTICWGGKTIVA
jgi:predicted nucleotidyltransferase